MSSRAARAQARSQRTPTTNPPAQPGAGGAGNNPPQVQLNQDVTNKEKYRDPAYFDSMLRRIGVTRACIDQLTNDDFDTMETVVTQYKGDISTFETYLKTINKTMNTAANPVRFSPVVMDRLLAVIHYFIQAITCFHTLPDIELIDRQLAMEMIEPYRSYKQFSTEEIDEEILITLPELKGHENWISYRDKFLSNLQNMPGSNGTPLSYVVNRTQRTAERMSQEYLEVSTMDLSSWDI